MALSGRNGLAVASPKATAIAGVSPEEAAAFSITLPSRNQLVIKTPNSAVERLGNDDYDYNDLPLAMANNFPRTRETPLRPSGAAAAAAAAVATDAIVEKWRTAIAEEYAARSKSRPQSQSQQTQTHATPNRRAAPKRRLHYQ